MPKGVSVHVGVNEVDPARYGGWDGKLVSCENDAFAMRDICRGSDMQWRYHLTKDATAERVLADITRASSLCDADDLFVLTFSCCGGQVVDPRGVFGTTSTLCLYDREIPGHELYRLLGTFRTGVRILMVIDACYRETFLPSDSARGRIKTMPLCVQERVHARNAGLIGRSRPYPPADPEAGIIFFEACQHNQPAFDGPVNGLFTERLLQVWNTRRFQGDHALFHEQVIERMPPEQTPGYFEIGEVTPAFRGGKPFVV